MSSETTPTSISRSVQPRQPQRPAARTPHPVRHPQQVVRRLPARVARRQGIREQRLVSAPSSPRAAQTGKDGAGVPRRRPHLGELTLLAHLDDSTNVRWHDAATPAHQK